MSCLPLNTSLPIQNLQFTSTPWLHTPKNQLTTLGTPVYEARQTRHFYEARQASKHAKFMEHAST